MKYAVFVVNSDGVWVFVDFAGSKSDANAKTKLYYEQSDPEDEKTRVYHQNQIVTLDAVNK